MNIGLIDVDGKYPNLALMKISAYHKNIGDNVEFATLGHYDIVYASKLFDFSTLDLNTFVTYDKILIGGSGYDLSIKLPQEIEVCDPDYSLYPNANFSIQFYSRGCIRKCPFCIVNKKEGLIQSVDKLKLNPNGKWIEVLDNNFFANPNWRDAIQDLNNTKQKVNLHGVDVRIINEEQAKALNSLKHHKQIHIAWDNPNDNILPKIETMLRWIKPYKIMCYVLIGYWSTQEEDLYRVMKLKELGIDPFVMAYNKKDKYQKRFARWCNHKAIFKSIEFKDYK
jgi:radical SAM superfamily enzyme YgiQ (UPF0313 family)